MAEVYFRASEVKGFIGGCMLIDQGKIPPKPSNVKMTIYAWAQKHVSEEEIRIAHDEYIALPNELKEPLVLRAMGELN